MEEHTTDAMNPHHKVTFIKMPGPSRKSWDASFGPLGEYMMYESVAFENEANCLRMRYDALCQKYTNLLTENININDNMNQQILRLTSRINVMRWEYNQLEAKNVHIRRRLAHSLRLLSHVNNQNKRFQAIAKRNGVLCKLRAITDSTLERLQRSEETSEESQDEMDDATTEEE